VASLYGRNNLSELVNATTKDVFIPLTVGGGIRSIDDAFQILRSGADKIAINTAAVKNPRIIENLAERFGSQCVVLSVEAKRSGTSSWEAYTDGGREQTGLDVLQWVKTATDLGAGEIFLTSVDQEGTRQGFDVELISTVSSAVSVPVIASGGLGKPNDLIKVAGANASAAAIADAFHYNRFTVSDIRSEAKKLGLDVRVIA
jgi:cyclase